MNKEHFIIQNKRILEDLGVKYKSSLDDERNIIPDETITIEINSYKLN